LGTLAFSGFGGAVFGGSVSAGPLANPGQAAIIENTGKGIFMGVLGGAYTVTF
jgi:hypothetical protein